MPKRGCSLTGDAVRPNRNRLVWSGPFTFKRSDTEESRLDPSSKTADKDWGGRLAEIADEAEARRKS